MAAPLVVTPNADLDYLLAEVAAALQLTPEQYRLAGEHYLAVGDWLAAPGSILAKFRPRIYPQGSMALETTVRPKGRDEYDLDLVCQMLPTGMSALNVYNEVYGRLMANRMYAPMVEKKNRCVRLNYAHQFHLDIIPAEPDQVVGGDAIRVPDRDLRDWTPSNPRGLRSCCAFTRGPVAAGNVAGCVVAGCVVAGGSSPWATPVHAIISNARISPRDGCAIH